MSLSFISIIKIILDHMIQVKTREDISKNALKVAC